MRSLHWIFEKIPSETVEKFYYDVVVKFTTHGEMNTLDKAPVEFFSNDPSFNYTFAHAFKKNKLTIKDLESKMRREALMKPAKEKNPQDTIGYVKTLYFAFIVMNEKSLFVPSIYTMNGKKYNKSFLLQKISNTEDKLKERTEASKKDNNPNDSGDSLIDDFLDAQVNKTKSTNSPNKIKNMNFIGRTKTIGSSKTVRKTKSTKSSRFGLR